MPVRYLYENIIKEHDLVTENYGMINSEEDESEPEIASNVLYGNMGLLEL